jgi:hypothetical protein
VSNYNELKLLALDTHYYGGAGIEHSLDALHKHCAPSVVIELLTSLKEKDWHIVEVERVRDMWHVATLAVSDERN